MNFRLILPLIALSLLFSACQKKSAPAPKSDVVRSQELFITSNENEKDSKLPHDVYFEQTIQLNNTDNTNIDLTLINRGGKPLKLQNIDLKDKNEVFVLKSDNCANKILQPRETCTINVAFKGEENKVFTADLEIHSNDRRREVARIKVIGHALNKYFGSISVTDLDVNKNVTNDVKLHFDALNNIQFLTISNDGLYPITLEQPKISGVNKDSYSFETTCSSTLDVAKSCDITIKYDSEAHDGYSIALLKVPSNGDITPSNKVRLIGYSKPYSLNISNFVVTQNVHDFMDDYFASQQTYYIRTIYQNNIDNTLQENIENAIDNFVAQNGYQIAATPDKADKVIILYPRIEQPNSSTDEQRKDMHFYITLNGYISTKSATQGLANFNKEELLIENNSSDTSFSSLTAANLYYSKEPFGFALQIDVDHANDKYDVYESIASTFVNKMFNVIGFPKRKGN